MSSPSKKSVWGIVALCAALVLGLNLSGWLSHHALDLSWSHLVIAAGFTLLPILYYAWVLGRRRSAPALHHPAAPWMLLLLVHSGIQFSGGLRSPLLAAYVLLVFVITFFSGRQVGALLALACIVLEGVGLWQAPLPGWSRAALFIWALTPFAAWVVAMGLGSGVEAGPSVNTSSIDKKETLSSTPYLLQIQARLFDPQRYLDESVRALFDMMAYAHPVFNSLVLWWVDEGGERLRMGQSQAVVGELVQGLVIDSGDGLVGYVLKEKRPLVSEQVSDRAAAALPYYSQIQQVKALVALPLFNEGRLVAVLSADKLEQGDVGPGEVEALQAMGNQIVREAQQAQFAAATEDQGRRYEGLYSVSRELGEKLDRTQMIANFQQMLGVLVPYNSYYLALREGETGEGRFRIVSKRGYTDEFLKNFNLDEDTAAGSWVFNAGEVLRFTADTGGTVPSFLADGLRQPARSFLVIPLMSEHRVIGLLKVDRGEKVPFDKEDEKIAGIFSGQASVALENARLYSLHLKRATTDGLTGLYNHRFFQERLASEIEAAKNSGLSLALGMTDIDLFKKFNDSFGHQEGDRVLKKVAALLQEKVRYRSGKPWDVVCRYGGEEFVVIMPDCDLVEAREVMEGVRRACEQEISGGNEEESRTVTLSIGISVYPKAADEQRRLIHLADAALYVCKEHGRNRVASYRDLPPDEIEKT